MVEGKENAKKKKEKKKSKRKEKKSKIKNQKNQKKIKKGKRVCFSVDPKKMCVFCLYPILDSQQRVKRGSCRCPILSELLCFNFLWDLGPVCVEVRIWALDLFRLFYFIESLIYFVFNCYPCYFFVSNIVSCSFSFVGPWAHLWQSSSLDLEPILLFLF